MHGCARPPAQTGLCAALAVICFPRQTPVSSYQGAPVRPAGAAVTMGVLCCAVAVGGGGRGRLVEGGKVGGQASTAETQEDGPRNASQQLLLLTNRNMRSWGR